MSRSKVTTSCNRPCASRSSRSCRPRRAAEQRALPAKGLTGRGYDGHTFWDMETYVLPLLTHAAPAAARDVLRWRHSTLELAAPSARRVAAAGRGVPVEDDPGEECSGYWPAGTAAFHINSDIAEAVRRYVASTGDTEFERGPGLDLLVETARLWASLGHFDAEGCFRIDGVTGPDEYSALANNNVFTNLMAARNLRAAAEAATRWPERAVDLGVEAQEIETWVDAAERWSSRSTSSSASRLSPRASPGTATGTSRRRGRTSTP